jgi:hypothetical protein
MSWRDWSGRQKLRLQLARLGQELTAIKNDFDLVSQKSSRMVANRIQHATSDYWKSVEAYSADEFETAKHLVAAGLVELTFIHKLLEAETTERELGAGEFFEYADKSDHHSSLDRIEVALELISVELNSFLGDCKRARMK